jgi:cytoskeleton protein RodZ
MSEPAALPGVKLKAERERRGLSAQKAADEMHLDRWVIDALEADDYARIGPTVYAKGHLKKYAALLGLPAAEIAAGFESRPVVRSDPAPAGPSMLLSTRDESSGSGGLTPLQVAGCVAVVLALGVLWWRPWHARVKAPASAPPTVSTTAPVDSPDSSIVSSAQAATIAAAAAQPVAAAANENSAGATSAANLPSAANSAGTVGGANAANAADAGAAPVAGAGRARLRLSFSADSWVDVHDAAGKRAFAGNGLANSVKTISGLAPMRVYLGAGSGVQLEINDRAVAIGPQFFAGDVARFEAGADGVLRRDTRADAARPDQTHGAPTRSPRPPG